MGIARSRSGHAKGHLVGRDLDDTSWILPEVGDHDILNRPGLAIIPLRKILQIPGVYSISHFIREVKNGFMTCRDLDGLVGSGIMGRAGFSFLYLKYFAANLLIFIDGTNYHSNKDPCIIFQCNVFCCRWKGLFAWKRS